MRPILSIFLLATLAIITSCGNQGSKPAPTVVTTTDDTTASTTLPPVETGAPNTNYAPAFAGQTRVGGVRTKTSYQAQAINTTLSKPWGITTLPDGRLLINEKKGVMRIATTTGAVGDEITGIPAVNSSGQGGLLGLCIDPGFAQNRMVYWVL